MHEVCSSFLRKCTEQTLLSGVFRLLNCPHTHVLATCWQEFPQVDGFISHIDCLAGEHCQCFVLSWPNPCDGASRRLKALLFDRTPCFSAQLSASQLDVYVRQILMCFCVCTSHIDRWPNDCFVCHSAHVLPFSLPCGNYGVILWLLVVPVIIDTLMETWCP